MRETRPVSWIRAALKEFETFPEGANHLPCRFDDHRGDAFRVVYAVQLADEIWVVDAFQKKATRGIKTPLREIDQIKGRLKGLKEMAR